MRGEHEKIGMLFFLLVTAVMASTETSVTSPPVWCCFHGFHYHECYERVDAKGCAIGESIVWPRPQRSETMVFGDTLKTLRYPTMNGGFMVCSDVPECAPTEAGGAFLRGVIKNCRECRGR
uniref:Uncharacterized protein n=1 Tax=viral metagenome TaxID=1070528 RepID=A0A6C0BMX3_9ZZZZ